MKVKLISIAMLLSFVAGNAAAETGQVSMTGTIADASCTITGLDKTISFGTFNTAAVQAMAHADGIAREDVMIDVTGCPSSDSNAELTVSYTPDGTGGRIMPEPGTDLMGASVILRPLAGGENIRNGDVITKPLVSGAAQLGFGASFMRAKHEGATGAATVIPGAFSALVNLELTTN